MDKEIQKPGMEINSAESTMEIVMKNIYSSCDPHNLNEVPTSELIEFIRPYMIKDLSALETLQVMLDPESKNINIDGEQFFNVIKEWAQKIASHSEETHNDDLNCTPSNSNELDDKLLPYTQSTPRESFGQKLLSCQDLLNLSNVSNYNSSPTKQTKDNSIVNQERTVLEEQIKQLHFQLNKVLGDNSMLKTQLTYSEEQNENLHDELEKLRTRLHSEHQPNGNLQDNKFCIEDMKEEITYGKNQIEELNKKLLLYEKDNNQLNMYVQKLEKENSDLADRCVQYCKSEQNLKKQLIEMKSELELKEQELLSETKINEELRLQVHEKRNELEQLLCENELLDYKKQSLEKMIISRRHSSSSQYYTCLDEMNSFNSRGSTIPIYASPFKSQSFSFNSTNSPPLTKTVLSPNSPVPTDPMPKMLFKVLQCSTPSGNSGLGMRKAFSLNAMPNILTFDQSTVLQDQGADGNGVSDEVFPSLDYSNYKSLQMELFQVDPQFVHKVKNEENYEFEEETQSLKSQIESLQNTIQILEKENKALGIELKTNGDKANNLDEKVKKLISDNQALQKHISNTQLHKTETKKLDLENKLEYLQDKYNRLKLEFETIERELEKKCDFEAVYKKLEIEYGQKIAVLEELQANCNSYKNTIVNLTNKNKDLETSLKECKAQLQETKENTNTDRLLKIEKLEKELQDKIKQIEYLKEILRKEADIKDKMWKDHQNLNSSFNVLTENYQNSLKKIDKLEIHQTELKQEHDNILSEYNQKIEKNYELSSQISSLEQNYSDVKTKNREEIKKTLIKLLDLKKETVCAREEHERYKDELSKLLSDCQNSLQQFMFKIKMVEKDLQDKTNQIGYLKEILKEKEYHKNKMLKDNQELNNCFNTLTEEYHNSLKKINELEMTEKKRNNIFFKYDEEVEKNNELCYQIALHKKDLIAISTKYQDEIKKHLKFQDEISCLKQERDFIRENQKKYNDDLNKWISAYQNSFQELSSRLKELEFQNKILKSDLNIEKQKLVKQQCNNKDSEVKSEDLDEDKLKTYFDNDSASDSSLIPIGCEKSGSPTKNISFERQKLTINRLREKLDLSENYLHNEKSKNDILQEKFISKQKEIHEIILDKKRLEMVINDLEDKLKKQEDYYKYLCNSSNEEIENLSLRLKQLDEIHRSNVSRDDVILECYHDVNIVFTKFAEQWKNIGMNPNFKKLPTMKTCQSPEFASFIQILVDNIKVIISLFNTLSSDTASIMESNTESQEEVIEPKMIKKFSLRPSKLHLRRSVSPDSPGLEMDLHNNQKADTTEKHLESSSSRMPLDYSRGDSSHIPPFSFDLQIQDTLSHITDDFLDKLGLHENSPRMNLSNDETEKIFASFAIKIGLDSKDINDRLQKQKELCTERHRKCILSLNKISIRLRDHNCLGASDPIKPVFVMLEDLRLQIQQMLQAVGQLGALSYENRMTKCWNLVTNYMAIIKQNTDCFKDQSSPNRNSAEKRNMLVEKFKNTEKQDKEAEGGLKYRFTQTIVWLSFFALLSFIGIIIVHWQCKMNTDRKICPLDNFIQVLSQNIGSPPY